jgi:hypothetical protein
MNTKFTHLRKISSVVGMMLGAFTVSVFAAWTPAPPSPPTCDSSIPGCNAPLNTGPSPQVKSGGLSINSDLFVGVDTNYQPLISGGFLSTRGIIILGQAFMFQPDPSNPVVTPGSVLTASSIGDGTVEWQPPSAAGATYYRNVMTYGIYNAFYNPSSSNIEYEDGYHSFIVPSGISKIRIQIWGGGGLGNGGGGGGYAEAELSVTPGARYELKVGGGGWGSGGNQSGQTTTVRIGGTTIMSASGGLANKNGGTASVTGAGVLNSKIVNGTAGTASVSGGSYGGGGGLLSTPYTETSFGGGCFGPHCGDGAVVIWW